MEMKFCDTIFKYKKRVSSAVNIGNVIVGGEYHVVIQTMGTVSTNDIEAATTQALSMAESGAELIRFTAQGVIEAENMGLIRSRMNDKGCYVPLVADIHFNPKAAFAAARQVEKVRINPGNFIDKKSIGIYSDELYINELERLDETFTALLEICTAHKTAIRIGVNHGSLSDRIVSRYGDTIEGMVESAMEFLRVARKRNFDSVVVSLKSSNTQVMVRAYRLLCAVMRMERMNYPLHLGVTEAGGGDQGRIRSAVGIGALLADGIGDTIRVSLTEKPESEVIFAKKLLSYIEIIAKERSGECVALELEPYYHPFVNKVSSSPFMIVESGEIAECDYLAKDGKIIGQGETRVVSFKSISDLQDNRNVEFIVIEESSLHLTRAVLLWFEKRRSEGAFINSKIIIKRQYNLPREEFMAAAGVDFGGLLIDGFADGVWISNKQLTADDTNKIVLDIMQATRRRVSSPEYISCPGCGRTLYDIQEVLEKVKKNTLGLKNIKLAVMGCIVNGPGEMADADYGYVGASRGKVTLYKKGEIYKKNIDQDKALDELIELLKINNEFL